MLSGFQASQGIVKSGMRAAHELRHDLDFGVVQNNIDIRNHAVCHRVRGKILDIQYILDGNLIADLCGNGGRILR